MHPGISAPEALLVDLDGTLVDSEPLWESAQQRLAEDLGLPYTAALRAASIGKSAHLWLPGWLRGTGMEHRVAELALRLENEVVAALELEVRLQPGALALLDAIGRSPLPTALVSASPRRLLTTALKALPPDTFDATIAAEDVDQPKPHPQPYQRAARAVGADPRRCVAIEDSLTGATSAHEAGCSVIWVPTDPEAAGKPDWLVLASLDEIDLGALAPKGAD